MWEKPGMPTHVKPPELHRLPPLELDYIDQLPLDLDYIDQLPLDLACIDQLPLYLD